MSNKNKRSAVNAIAQGNWTDVIGTARKNRRDEVLSKEQAYKLARAEALEIGGHNDPNEFSDHVDALYNAYVYGEEKPKEFIVTALQKWASFGLCASMSAAAIYAAITKIGVKDAVTSLVVYSIIVIGIWTTWLLIVYGGKNE